VEIILKSFVNLQHTVGYIQGKLKNDK